MENQTDALIRADIEVKKPNDFAVILWNDHITTMEFVVHVLTKVFYKSPQDSAKIMMEVHELGHGVAGVYTYDIAVSKKAKTDAMSAEKGFPLKLTIREMEDET